MFAEDCIDIVNVILKIAIMTGVYIYIILYYFVEIFQILDPFFKNWIIDILNTSSKKGEAIQIKC